MAPPSTIFNWSTGKDSAMALHQLLNASSSNIAGLLTSISAAYQRVSMHGIRLELLEAQAHSIGLPLYTMEVPTAANMETYDVTLKQQLLHFKQQGVTQAAFGDIFLEDLRAYRESKLAEVGLEAVFPLWKRNTTDLAQYCLEQGFKAIVTCVDESRLDKSFAGRQYDKSFLQDLPAAVDPCGENGEFHTFVFDGPIFRKPVKFITGEVVHRTYAMENSASASNAGFWYTDLLPKG